MSAKHLTLLTGASRGMGRAMAEQLLDAGHTLVGISRKTDDALAAKARQNGATLLQWSFDLAAPEAAAERVAAWLAEQDTQAFDSVTLINNAGTVGRLINGGSRLVAGRHGLIVKMRGLGAGVEREVVDGPPPIVGGINGAEAQLQVLGSGGDGEREGHRFVSGIAVIIVSALLRRPAEDFGEGSAIP